MELHRSLPCLLESARPVVTKGQGPLCFTMLLYILSLSGAREEKRGQKCEKERGPDSHQGREEDHREASENLVIYMVKTGCWGSPAFRFPLHDW